MGKGARVWELRLSTGSTPTPVRLLAISAQVRVDCIQGLRKLGQLRTVNWSRMADDLCMYPSPHMIRLVDKKFGGELNKVCVGEVWEV